MNLNIEIPIKIREYERSWNFSRHINRLSISLGQDEFDSLKYAQYLSWISEEKGMVCFEIDELYSDEVSLLTVLNLKLDSIKSPPADKSCTPLSDTSLTLYKYDKYCYSIIIPPSRRKIILPLLSLDSREFFITYWGNRSPQIITYRSTKNRVEELYLNQLGAFDPVVFLSPSHNHMEIMSYDEVFLAKCVECAEI